MNIRSVTLPDTISYISESAFRNMEELEIIRLSKSLEIIDDAAFLACKKLKKIELPDSLESIGDYAFSECESLEKPAIPDSMEYVGNRAFGRCPQLADKEGFVIIGGVLHDYFGSEANVTVPDGVEWISSYVFAENEKLTTVNLPDGLEEIKHSAFINCKNLKSINIPTSTRFFDKLTFKGCNSLADKEGFVIINGVLCDYIGNEMGISVPCGVTRIFEGAFSGNCSITSITIPKSVERINSYAFKGCKGLADKDGYIVVNGVLYDYVGEKPIW